MSEMSHKAVSSAGLGRKSLRLVMIVHLRRMDSARCCTYGTYPGIMILLHNKLQMMCRLKKSICPDLLAHEAFLGRL